MPADLDVAARRAAITERVRLARAERAAAKERAAAAVVEAGAGNEEATDSFGLTKQQRKGLQAQILYEDHMECAARPPRLRVLSVLPLTAAPQVPAQGHEQGAEGGGGAVCAAGPVQG